MKFYLDNILLQNEPNGEITTTIKRDAELGGYLITNDAKLNFIGDGYDYINSILEAEGYCGEIDIIIKDECNGVDVQIFVGKIFMLQIEKNNNCIITTPLQDNNYYARISKNKSIKTFIDSTRSKNGTTIEAAATNAMTMFNPATGATLAATRQGWRAYDVYKNIVSFLSDGEMTFDSTLLGLGGEFEGLSITTGQELFNASSGKAPSISFSDFHTEINKKLHVAIFIDLRGSLPKMLIEYDAVTYTTNIIKKLEAVGEVMFKVDETKLIAKISVGSTQLDYSAAGGGVSFVEANSYFTFRNEDYTPLGQCNIDATIDLVSNYILSSNIIEDILMYPTNNFSDAIFFIDCENVVTSGINYVSNAIASSPFTTTPPVFYNRRLMNDQVLSRWKNSLPQSIANFSGNTSNLFRAESTQIIINTVPQIYSPFIFDNDYSFPNFDGGNLYGNNTMQGTPVSAANSRFTCPDPGNYNFFIRIHAYRIAPITGSMTVAVYIRRKDSGGGFLDMDSISFPVGGYLTDNVLDFPTKVFSCLATDYFEVDVIAQSTSPGDSIGFNGFGKSFFLCLNAPFSNGILIYDDNQALVPVIKASGEYPIKNSDFYDIQDNLFDKIAFTYNVKNSQKIQSGWIDIIKYNHNTSMAQITLRGTQQLIQ